MHYLVVRRVRLLPKHARTGKTRHFYRGREVPPPSELLIARYPDYPGYYLLHVDDCGNELADTYHDTLDDAIEQARWEFQVKPEDWEALEP